MNGAQALFAALLDAGYDTCFANPGTSEMQLVYEIGLTDAVRPVLCLQENVVTGAADGYARIAGKAAFTLLHVGSGFANGIANLHNAGRANSAILNIVGANANYHQPNFPEHELIGGRIEDLARPVSHWTREARSAADLGRLGAEAARLANSGSGRICTLIAPTNCHWDPAPPPPAPLAVPAPLQLRAAAVAEAAGLLRNGKRTVLLLGGHAMLEANLETAARIAAHSGARLMTETFPSRLARGVGRPRVEVVPYFLELAIQAFGDVEQVLLIGALPPVSTFAYENRPASKLPPGCAVHSYLTADHDFANGLQALLAELGAEEAQPVRIEAGPQTPPSGDLTPDAIGQSIRQLLPADSILVEEGGTAGLPVAIQTAAAAPHDYLYSIGGGAIGGGLPVALGAAIAAPARKVVAVQADGSGLYTNQALWSMAHEECDVTVVVLKNDAYAVLNVELARVCDTEPTPGMRAMLDLNKPGINWVKLAESFGVRAVAATTADDFHRAFQAAMATPGPQLIEATIVQDLSPVVNLIRAQRHAS